MAESDFDRTEPATQRRREEARQEGNVARSTDLSAAVALLGGIVLLQVFGSRLLTVMHRTLESLLANRFAANATRADDLGGLAAFSARMVAEAVLPLILCLTGLGMAVTAAQVGLRLTPTVLRPDFARLYPFRGLRHFFDMRGRVRFAMSLAKLGLVIGVAAWFIWGDLPRIVGLSELPATLTFLAGCGIVYALALKLAAVLLLLALIDFGYQWWQRERDLRMTKAEVREEFRRIEGDPLTKQRRARVARQLALQRVQSAVPQADVVVTNPTHFAVALRYDAQRMKAPKVIAKGADYLAMRIRQLAALHGVPLVERRELAQALYKSVEVGQEVPPQFYNAVAEVLAYVYRLAGRRTA